MRKHLFIVMAFAMSIVCAGCGNASDDNGGKNPVVKDENGETVTSLGTPSDMDATVEDGTLVLTWGEVKNAAGYRVFAGSSRYSDDYEEITESVVADCRFTLPTPDYKYYKVISVNGDVESQKSEAVSLEQKIFGQNVYIYSPSDEPAKVAEELNSLFIMQEMSQFFDHRYAVMFKPGEYAEEIQVKMGFYMDVMGLGALPTDTTIQSFNCTATWLGDDQNHNATCNFWRGVSNLQVNSDVMWAVSQATFMRRMQINGNLALHDNGGWASGGFLSDSVITGIVDSGSQQQWLSRNCDWASWMGENWNIVFVGTEEGKAPTATWPAAAYTAEDETPIIKEKPYLVFEDGEYNVYVPKLKEKSEGVSWVEGDIEENNDIISLDAFYIANPETDTAKTINEALENGNNLLFTPGIYELDEAIIVDNPNTIVLGIGYATLRPTAGNVCMEVEDVDGVILAGVLFDAGTEKSETLLRVGKDKVVEDRDDEDKDAESDEVVEEATGDDEQADALDTDKEPILLADVFFRVGGVVREDTAVDSCVIINADSVIGDNFWVWRADHGDGVAWDKNTAPNGIIVNGDNVTIYALMVEHFQEYQTVWNGENGSVYFYQSELPYDVPMQNKWCSHDGKLHGYASYYVAENVKKHTAVGIGIYSYNRDAVVEEYCAMEVPEVDGMNLRNVCAIMITGNPGISHVINSYGDPAYYGGVRSIITDFNEARKNAKNKDK